MLFVIIWGTTIKRTPLGFAADYCPGCRAIRVHRVVRIGAASHLWYVTFGSGKHVGYEATCEDCGFLHWSEKDRYEDFVKQPPLELDALVRSTYPYVRGRFGDELERAARLRALSPEERLDEIRDAFGPLEYLLQRQQDKPANTPAVWFLGITTFVLFAALAAWFILVAVKSRRPIDTVTTVLFFSMLAGFLATLIAMAFRNPHFLRHKFRPRLRQLLAPLDPKLDELQVVWEEARAEKFILAKKLKPPKMLDWIREDDETARLEFR